MSGVVSGNYRRLAPHEIFAWAAECAKAWQDPAIPGRQYEIAEPELRALREGNPCAPFVALSRCLKRIQPFFANRPRLLDVGASGSYYSEVLSLLGFTVDYRGVDYSEAFQRLAGQLYPGVHFDVADATALPYEDNAVEIVLHGACIMHIANYERALMEAARVTSRYVVLHRTPVLAEGPTQYFRKEAYGVPCLEIHFNELALLEVLRRFGLFLAYVTDVFTTDYGFAHRTYLLEKLIPEPYASCKAV